MPLADVWKCDDEHLPNCTPNVAGSAAAVELVDTHREGGKCSSLAPMPQSIKCDNDDMQIDSDVIDDKLDDNVAASDRYGPLPSTTESNKESFSPLKSSMPSSVSTSSATGAYYEKWLIPGV
ncbi:unnamed protein product [Trichobilharzia regenti]|nr:unnamed protein product [Trichobilharzia regenti]